MRFLHVIIRTSILLEDIVGFECKRLCFVYMFDNLEQSYQTN